MNVFISILAGCLVLGVIVSLYVYLHRKTNKLHLLYDHLYDLVLKSENITELEMLKKDLEKLATQNFSREFYYRAKDIRHLIEHDINMLKK